MFALRSSKNRVVKNDLTVTYSIEKVDYTDTDDTTDPPTVTTGSWYRVTRRATKTYSYVDMTQVGAMNCANEMVALYTRQSAILDKRASGDTVPDVILVGQLQSSITPTRETGNIWRVDISVQETDVRPSATSPSDPASLFATENARSYDTETGDIKITAQNYSSAHLILTVDHDLGSDERDNIVLLYKLSPNAANWEQVCTGSGLTWTNASTLSLSDTMGLVDGQSVVALRYGNAMSNTVTVNVAALTLGSVDIWSSETATQFNFPNGDAPTDGLSAVVKFSSDGGSTVSSRVSIRFSQSMVSSAWALYDEEESSCPLYTAMVAARSAGQYVAIEMTNDSTTPVTVKSSWTNVINAY